MQIMYNLKLSSRHILKNRRNRVFTLIFLGKEGNWKSLVIEIKGQPYRVGTGA